MVTRKEFNRIKKEIPESRIGQRIWEEQKVRNKLAKAMKDGKEDKERKFRIEYISQKIKGETNVPLNQDDLLFLLSLSKEDFIKLPNNPSFDKKYMYLFKWFKNIKVYKHIMNELENKSKKEVYGFIKRGIAEDSVFRYMSIDEALEYLSQRELANILIYNSNDWTQPFGQLDILAYNFDKFPELDPLEVAKEFESQVGIREGVFFDSRDPIGILMDKCKQLAPEFEKYLIEKGYKGSLNERKRKYGEKAESNKVYRERKDIVMNNNEYQMRDEAAQVVSGFGALIERDKRDIDSKINEFKLRFGRDY